RRPEGRRNGRGRSSLTGSCESRYKGPAHAGPFLFRFVAASLDHDFDLLARLQRIRRTKSVDHSKAPDGVVEVRHTVLPEELGGFTRLGRKHLNPQRFGSFNFGQAETPERINRGTKGLVHRGRHSLGRVDEAIDLAADAQRVEAERPFLVLGSRGGGRKARNG